MRRKKGVVNHHHFNKPPFLNFFYARCRPPHPRLAPYTPEVETQAPAHPDRPPTQKPDTLHRSALDTRQTAPGDLDGGGRWRAWSVSETVQICTRSNMNDFQHKNVCKTVDINTRTCYYIDNTRTCYTTTKQEDKNHEKVLPRYCRTER